MEPTVLKKELVARSRISSLEELESRGRQRVKIIRADHIAELIDSAVEQALEQQGDLVSRAEVDELLDGVRQDARQALQAKQAEIERLNVELDALQTSHQPQGSAQPATPATVPPQTAATVPPQTAATVPPQTAATAPAADPATAANSAADAIANAVDQLNNAMSDRLEKMSRKLGISTAVEADDVNLSHLFDHDDDGGTVESNIENMQVKSKTGSGIAANLARLKKLKGGD